jgi:hypothetical protein
MAKLPHGPHCLLFIATEMSIPTQVTVVDLPPDGDAHVTERVERGRKLVAARIDDTVQKCAVCRREPPRLDHSCVVLAPDQVPLSMAYYDIPFCHDKDNCMQQAETLRQLIDDSFKVTRGRRMNWHACNNCMAMEKPGGPRFTPCPHCGDMFYCSEDCRTQSWDRIHARSCMPRRPFMGARGKVRWMTVCICLGAQRDGPSKILTHEDATLEAPIAPDADAAAMQGDALFQTWIQDRASDKRRQITAELPTPWYCVCGRMCTERTGKTCDRLPVGPAEPPHHWAVVHAVLPVCSAGCLERGDRFLDEVYGCTPDTHPGARVDCGTCHAYPPLSKPWPRCTRCWSRSYCSTECQKKDWKHHKEHCNKKDV